MSHSVKVEQFIHSLPAEVYLAFTNASYLRGWLCDVATVNPRPGSRFYLAWNSGYYTAGEYLELHKDKALAFTWRGRNEPRPTQVVVKLTRRKGGVLLKLTHKRIGEGKVWAAIAEEYAKEWKSGLENLASVLETGADLRITRRPMLGISLNDFDADTAKKLCVPVSEGVRIDGVLPGMGAQQAGLQANDVIVKLGEQEVVGFSSVGDALQGKRAGDHVEVVVYRGPQKLTLPMQLSGRRMPEIPATLDELARRVKERAGQALGDLDKFLDSVSEAEASFKPAPTEWSVKEVLAHLLEGERYYHFHIAEMVVRQEAWADDYGGNLQASIDATLAAFPTLKLLREEFGRLNLETVTLFARLPAEFFQNKGAFWRLSYEALEDPFHLHSHMEQMRAAVEAARKK
jgi:uncharacterized protein YndB with AHSA1/START domain